MESHRKTALLELAHNSLVSAFSDREAPPQGLPEEQEKVSGVFVTLERDGELRGCKGCVEGDYPLEDTVWVMARSSAFDDPRFEPLEEEELEGLEISISVLTPMERIFVDDYSEYRSRIRFGIDGVSIKLGWSSALFLPEVAESRNWDVDTTLEHLCQKAGLAADDWKNPEAEIYRFQTIHITPGSPD